MSFLHSTLRATSLAATIISTSIAAQAQQPKLDPQMQDVLDALKVLTPNLSIH